MRKGGKLRQESLDPLTVARDYFRKFKGYDIETQRKRFVPSAVERRDVVEDWFPKKYEMLDFQFTEIGSGADLREKTKGNHVHEIKNLLSRLSDEGKKAGLISRDVSGDTVLHIAVREMNVELVKLYLNLAKELKINSEDFVNSPNKQGDTAIMTAVKSDVVNHYMVEDVLDVLKEHGAMQIEDKKGKSVEEVMRGNYLSYLVPKLPPISPKMMVTSKPVRLTSFRAEARREESFKLPMI